MTYQFVFHPAVRGEIIDTMTYLGEQREGYDMLFNLRVDEAITQIIANPTRWSKMDGFPRRYRKLLTKPFNKSYSIYYDFDGEIIEILSVFNNRRDDTIWKER